jgi:hypothetical protein
MGALDNAPRTPSTTRPVSAATPVRDQASLPDRDLAGALARRQSHDALDALLQRAVLGRAAAVGGPLLQRLVGFEAELMVPSLGPSHKKLTYVKKPGVVTDAIKRFLDGGVPYGTNIGGKGGSIRIDSDHSDKISRKPIVDKLKQLGYVTGNPKEHKTKLEYVTRAIDELAPGSDQEFADLAEELEEKLAETVKDAKSGAMYQLDPPAKAGFSTGVPVERLKWWLGKDDYAQIEPLVKDFLENKTSDSVYLQATVGIIPTGLRRFLRRSGQTGGHVELDPPSAARRQVLNLVDAAVRDLERDPAFADHDWVQNIDAVSHEALMGILSLVYTYLLGDTLHRTTGGTASTAKNAVPFLIKHGPWNLVELAGNGQLRRNPPPDDLIQEIGAIFKRSKYLKPAYWIKRGKDTAKGEGLIKKPLEARAPKEELLQGDYGDVVAAFLGGTGGAVQAVVGKELPGMDELNEDAGGVNIAYESYGQRAIPVEYRWISKQYKVSEIPMAMWEIFNDVRHANMSELTDEQEAQVRAQFRPVAAVSSS